MIMLSTLICSSINEAAKEKLKPFSSLSGDESYQSRDLEKVNRYTLILFLYFPWDFTPRQYSIHLNANFHVQASQQVAKALYDEKVQPTTLIPKQVGNMYTASLYAAFASLIHNKNSTLVKKKKIFEIDSWSLDIFLS